MFELIAVVFIVLHAPDGREIDVAVEGITSLRCRLEGVKNEYFDNDVNTLINMADGKHISVKENCNEVRRMIERAK